jgi:ring-1,2-phenylacetyl-CoA epoxidase subunit PaaE
MSLNAEFHKLRVAEVRRETADAVSILFDIPGPLQETFRFKAGQHLTLRADLNGEDLRRNYSICAAPHENEIRIAVKLMPGGRFSNWMNAALRPG